MRYRVLVAALAMLACAVLPVRAQAPDAGARVAAAREMMEVAGVAKQFDQAMPMLAQQMAQGFVAIAPDKAAEIREVFAQMAAKFIDRKGELIDKIATIYAEALTAEEIAAVTVFYKSPAGARFIAAQPDIMRQTMIMGQRWGARSRTRRRRPSRRNPGTPQRAALRRRLDEHPRSACAARQDVS